MTTTRRAMRSPTTAGALLLAAWALSASASAAELYRWVDERGVVNYSNTPPPKTVPGKPPALVEDRVSVYTPEKAVTDAIARDRERRVQPPPAASFTREPERPVTPPPPPPPPLAYDPCVGLGDPNCPIYLYDGSPVFHGRRRPPRLHQPEIPPGTIAGQASGPNAVIPGLSGTTPPQSTRPRASSGTGGFTMREPERDSPRR